MTTWEESSIIFSVDKGIRKTVGGEILPSKGGVAYGAVCIYRFNFDIRDRLHIGNKKEIAAPS